MHGGVEALKMANLDDTPLIAREADDLVGLSQAACQGFFNQQVNAARHQRARGGRVLHGGNTHGCGVDWPGRPLHAFVNGSERRDPVLLCRPLSRTRIRVDHGRKLHRKPGTLELAINPQMIPAKHACADHRYAHRFASASFFLAGEHLLHRALYGLTATSIQLQKLRHLVFWFDRGRRAKTNRAGRSLRAHMSRPCDELQQVKRDVFVPAGADVSFDSQCILHVSKINSDAIDPARRAQIGYKHLMGDTSTKSVVVMGSYVADLAFRTPKLPAWGETRMGSGFQLGPGGKGSNQAVAAARVGANVSFISKVGSDSFGEMARAMWKNEGIDASNVSSTASATGAAAIILDQSSGENAIIVVPGACYELSPEDIDRARPVIERAGVFMTQLELPIATVVYGLELAHSLGLTTILNPAPACALPDAIYSYCDFVTPNESEAEILTGVRVQSLADAVQAADAFLARGARNAIITLGARGALGKNAHTTQHFEAFDAGPVLETTGAGDAFNGGLAAALAEGRDLLDATRFACAVASISVTRPGTAPSMPQRAEVDALLAR